MKVLVTGGAGYIGSHVVRLLQERGDEVVVVDDLSEGVKARIGNAKLVTIDLAAQTAQDLLKATLANESIDAVVHLAARKKVGESVEKPEWYYAQNIGGMANLMAAMREAGVKKLVFSSSAATYGVPNVAEVNEDYICQPINPYGETKLIGEWMVEAAAAAWGLRGVNLRYFNVAGAGWPDLADTAVANLVPIVFAAIRADKDPIVFGNDYETTDGSCVRDYVHVHDLADAHLAAIDYLNSVDKNSDDKNGDDRKHSTFNVGTGKGSSVFEVLDEIKKVSGIDFKIDVQPRRAGDPPFLCADVSRIKETMGWSAKHNLHDIVQSAWSATA
jgi:UDP-glucose 4-epimerase